MASVIDIIRLSGTDEGIKKCLQFLGNNVEDDYLFREYCCNVREFGIKILTNDDVETVRVGDYVSRKGDTFTIYHKTKEMKVWMRRDLIM